MFKFIYVFISEYVYVYGCLHDVTVMFKSDFKIGEILMKSDIGLQLVAGLVDRILMGATGRMLVFLIFTSR